MSDVREYRMTKRQLAELREACRPVPYVVVNGKPPRSLQEKAEAFWKRLGRRFGFNWRTVRPAPERNQQYFLAEPEKDDDAS